MAFRADHEEVGHIRARDQEDDRDRAEQDPKRRRHAADHVLAKRRDHRTILLHRSRVRSRAAQPLLDPSGQRLHLRHKPVPVSFGSDAGDHVRPESARRHLGRTNHERYPERGALVGKAELGRKDTDHRAGHLGELVATADYLRIAPEPVLPEPVAQDDDLIVVLVRGESPEERSHSEGAEEGGGRAGEEELLGATLRSWR